MKRSWIKLDAGRVYLDPEALYVDERFVEDMDALSELPMCDECGADLVVDSLIHLPIKDELQGYVECTNCNTRYYIECDE